MSETSGSTDDGSSFSSLYESLSRVTRLPGVSLLMSTLSEMSTTAGVSHVPCPQAVVLRRTVFALWMHLDEHLLGAHDLDHLADIGPRLLQQAELFPQ
jgi:hypothetical protein